MRVVIQRSKEASVTIDGKVHGRIDHGLVVLVCFQSDDDDTDIDWMVKKVTNLRIFDDENGVMNRSVVETDGGILVISQFTLLASTKKGNRPSYIKAAPHEISVPLYETFKKKLAISLGKDIQCGIFGADMKVALINDGPVTILIDSKIKE